MSEVIIDPQKSSSSSSSEKISHIIYLLLLLAPFNLITGIVAIIFCYIKIDDVRGTWLESHFIWQLRTFWYGLLWAIIGFTLVLILIGHLILFINLIWFIYRVIKGWIRLAESKQMYV